MRLILLFDLPSVEAYEKKEYRIFKNALLKNGYTMMQFSVYMKPINGQIKIEIEAKKLRKYIPESGNIRMLQVTEKQYLDMYMVLGHQKINEIYNNGERYIKV